MGSDFISQEENKLIKRQAKARGAPEIGFEIGKLPQIEEAFL
jgi:hypothetical protein